MCLLDLIKQHDAIWLATHPLAELSTLLESNISRRRSDQSGNIELFHIFAHVQTDHIVFRIKQILCEALRQLGLSYTGRSEE